MIEDQGFPLGSNDKRIWMYLKWCREHYSNVDRCHAIMTHVLEDRKNYLQFYQELDEWLGEE